MLLIEATDTVNLTALMKLTSGNAAIKIGLVDGPVAVNHPDLNEKRIFVLPGKLKGRCSLANSAACAHGTYVAGVLCGKRGSIAPAICPDCMLVVRPIFTEESSADMLTPAAVPSELASAIIDCVKNGVHIINLSVGLAYPSSFDNSELIDALNYAMVRGVIVVAAAGNQGLVGGSVITRHHGVIPVVACDDRGRTFQYSNLGRSIARGLSAPGDGITSLGVSGDPLTLGGTSVATPFVTGAIALIWSKFPNVGAADIKLALLKSSRALRRTIVPPLLDAFGSFQLIARAQQQ